MCSTCALRDIAKLRRKWEGDTYVRFVPKVRTKRRGTGRLFSMQERDVYRARILEYITSISPRWISRKGMIEYLCSILPPDKSRAWPRLYYWTVNQPCIERRKVKGRIASIRKKQKEGDSNGEKT